MAKTNTTSTTNSNLPGFRLVFRGKTRGGVSKRAVRTVHVKDMDSAAGYMAENGEKLAKGCGFAVDFCKVYPPVAK